MEELLSFLLHTGSATHKKQQEQDVQEPPGFWVSSILVLEAMCSSRKINPFEAGLSQTLVCSKQTLFMTVVLV